MHVNNSITISYISFVLILDFLPQQGAIVVVIIWLLDLYLPMQSVPITTNVLSSNPAQARYTLNIGHTVFQGKITYSEGLILLKKGVWVMVFKATFNHVSVISWRSVLIGYTCGIKE
jgi:hypothetical protein